MGKQFCQGIWLIRNSIAREGTPPCGKCVACVAAADAKPKKATAKKADDANDAVSVNEDG